MAKKWPKIAKNNPKPQKSSSSSHPASLPASRLSDLCVYHTSCLSVGSVAWPRRHFRIACLQAYVPASRSYLHCTALSPTLTFTYTHTPVSYLVHTYTAPHARITGLTHHECPAAPHNPSPSHTHSHTHIRRVAQ